MSKTLDISNILTPDCVAHGIANKWVTWDTAKQKRIADWKELQQYVFATTTDDTPNSKLPWSNKTVIPKLCQIRDNLHANYMAALFPKRKWLSWRPDDEAADDKAKVEFIESYMSWATDRNQYYDTVSRLVLDYIDYGNVFASVGWYDGTNKTTPTVGSTPKEQVGYVGPEVRRISPLDVVFNPAAPSFEQSPKIVRSMISLGEVKLMMMQDSADEDEKLIAQELYDYLKDIRNQVTVYDGAWSVRNNAYQIAGFDSFVIYLQSNEAEVLTFYGDFYDEEKDELLKNYVIKVVDRHKVIYKKPNVSYFGTAPIFHCGWRLRPDNLWAQGPLDNLVGMQYRICHLENMKADCFDLTAYPPLKIKGFVHDFKWGPMERIVVGDDGDVQMMSPDVNALTANTEIASVEAKMEEMAGSPKEAMGFRTPGEKTKYEVQSLENAAGRVFQNKIAYFERQIVENALNAMLELARRNMTLTTIRVFDPVLKINDFLSLTSYDITGNGRIKPMGARHFAEQAQAVQNLTGFFNSSAGSDPTVLQHFSSIKLAELWEYLLEVEDYNLIEPYVRLTEQAEQERQAQVHQQQVVMEGLTPDGITQGDEDFVTPTQGAAAPPGLA
jgi:hypothetical protein